MASKVPKDGFAFTMIVGDPQLVVRLGRNPKPGHSYEPDAATYWLHWVGVNIARHADKPYIEPPTGVELGNFGPYSITTGKDDSRELRILDETINGDVAGKARMALGSVAFCEGWAMYAERVG